jgi:hypothetical protein
MGQEERKIAQDIRTIAQGQESKMYFAVMSGVIVSVDNTAMTCEVKLTCGDDATPTDGILLNVFLENKGGVYLIPAVNVNCLVCEVDGPGQLKELLKADSYTNIVMQASNVIQFNSGSFGGLTKTQELQTQINKLNTLVSHLVTIINGVPIDEPGSGAPSALQAALQTAIVADEVGDFSDIEDTKVTH